VSYYFIKSKLDGNVIDIQGASTANGVPLDAWPQKTSGTNNQLWEFVPDPAGSGYYFIKSQLNGNVIDIKGGSPTPATALDSWPQQAPSQENQLWQFYEDPGGSGYYYIQSKLVGNAIDIMAASTSSGALLDAYFPKVSGYDNQLWQVVGGTFPATVTAAPKPSAGLGSNSNYLFSCGNIPMTGVTVSIKVYQEIAGSDGFGFQVNCYSGTGDYDGAQQYVITMDPHISPPTLIAWVNNWHTTSDAVVNHMVTLATLPSEALPAGYELKISLECNSGGQITGANYQCIDNTGKVIGNQTITLLSISGVTSEDLAPIVAFQMNFVDWANGGKTVLSSGNGTIVYTANNPMVVLNTEPSYVDWGFSTEETANSSYSVLPNHDNEGFTQTFQYAPSGEVIKKTSAVMHALTPPKP
jgi:hypothetical protein